MKRYIQVLFVAIIGVALSSCVKDNFDLKEKFSDEIEWNPSLALPIAKADLTLVNIAKERKDTLEHVSESTLGYGSNSDDKVIQFNYIMDTARLIDVMHLPLVEPYDTTLTLDPVEISDVSFPIGYVSINDLIKDNFSSSVYDEYIAAGPLVTMAEHSATTEHRYPVGGMIPDAVKDYIIANFGKEINVKDVFEFIVLKSGSITLSCTNSSGFNFYCDVVIGSYNDKGEYVEFATFDYSNYPSWISQGGPQKRIYNDIDSSYLNSEFYFSFKNLRIAQASSVVTDFDNMGILLNIDMKNLVAYAGKAYVPVQELSMDTITYMTMRDEDLDRKLYRVLVEKGRFHYDITSTIGLATEFIVEFPSVDSLGKTPIRKHAKMTNEHPTYSDDWYLDNNNIDLTQNPNQAYNSIPIKVGYKVNTTGGMLYFGPEQYIKVEITNPDSIVFAYAEGDLARFDQDLFNEELDFDLKEFVSDYVTGDLKFYDPKIRINFENPVGIGGNLELNIVGKDDKGNAIDAFAGYANLWTVHRPTCDSVSNGYARKNQYNINKNTSNIVDFINMLPSKINYAGTFHVNADIPYGEPIFNCISNKGSARLGVEIELPLNMSAKNLVIQQEVPLDMSDLGDLSAIERVRLYINTEHQLPVSATMKLSLMDTTLAADKQYLGTLDMVVLESAPTTNGKVARDAKRTSEEEITLEKGNPMLDNFKQANKLLVEILLETDKNGDVPVIFYSYYGLKLNLAADCKFIYTSK